LRNRKPGFCGSFTTGRQKSLNEEDTGYSHSSREPEGPPILQGPKKPFPVTIGPPIFVSNGIRQVGSNNELGSDHKLNQLGLKTMSRSIEKLAKDSIAQLSDVPKSFGYGKEPIRLTQTYFQSSSLQGIKKRGPDKQNDIIQYTRTSLGFPSDHRASSSSFHSGMHKMQSDQLSCLAFQSVGKNQEA
jgi:hypothetical protein